MDALDALALHIAWGADEALAETPVDRTRVSATATPVRRGAAEAAGHGAAEAAQRRPAAVAGPARPSLVARAEQIAAAATTPEALRAALAGFTDCPLAVTATNLVFADGNPAAGLVLVGEAPGAEEDLAGRPFVGASGKFLDRMLASVALDRDGLLITNLIPWRPPGNRAPTDSEVLMCLPFLRRHLALLRPRIVVTLGALSTRALTGEQAGIGRLRGKWRKLALEGGGEARLLPMLHPAYLLRSPGAKREAWQDWLALRAALDGEGA